MGRSNSHVYRNKNIIPLTFKLQLLGMVDKAMDLKRPGLYLWSLRMLPCEITVFADVLKNFELMILFRRFPGEP